MVPVGSDPWGGSGLRLWDPTLPAICCCSWTGCQNPRPAQGLPPCTTVRSAGSQACQDHLQEAAAQMTNTQLSGGPRGAKNLHFGLCGVSYARADACAAHMWEARHQKVLHTRLGKPITSEATPRSVTYTHGSDSTPETSGLASTSLWALISHAALQLPAEVNVSLPQITGHSILCVTVPLRGTAGNQQ